MTGWTNDQLDELGGTEEIEIAPRRADGQLGRPRPIWIVRLGDDVYVRSYTGPSGGWFRTSSRSGRATVHTRSGEHHEVDVVDVTDVDRATIDAAYRTKYGRSGYVDAMVTDSAAATTMRLTPHEEDE